MSQWDIKALEANFEGFQKERFPNLSRSEAFERFTVRQVLRDADLSDDEVESGIVGGEDDGGIDAIYFFVNRTLIDEETDLPDSALEATLFIFQTKMESGFSETAVQKMESFTRDLLDHNRPATDLLHLNSDVRDASARFRENYDKILASQHTMTVAYIYATKSDQEANPKVISRVSSLKLYVKEQLSDARVDFQFWGCKQLVAAARRVPRTTQNLDISKHFTTDDGSVVCLARLSSLATFLRNDDGTLRRSMLEPNVRDYQGRNNPLNAGIRQTLNTGAANEFWWLNNGVTILAARSYVAGNKCVIDSPEVVNGLQTSYEIFQYFSGHPEIHDDRNVLVRVIVPPDEQMRSRIIKATNSQTAVSDLLLHATDAIHFDIEEKFRLYKLFYERRKGEYRELRKPVNQIISIHTLARAVMAILLRQPNDARGSPMRVLKNEKSYKQVFNEDYNRDVYVACILIQRQVDEFLKSRSGLTRDWRTDLRFYLSLIVACELVNSNTPTDKSLSAVLSALIKPIDHKIMAEACQKVKKKYQELGATDRIAKGSELREAVIEMLKARFPK